MKKRFEFLLFMCGDMYIHTYEKAIINDHLSLSGLISRVEDKLFADIYIDTGSKNLLPPSLSIGKNSWECLNAKVPLTPSETPRLGLRALGQALRLVESVGRCILDLLVERSRQRSRVER